MESDAPMVVGLCAADNILQVVEYSQSRNSLQNYKSLQNPWTSGW